MNLLDDGEIDKTKLGLADPDFFKLCYRSKSMLQLASPRPAGVIAAFPQKTKRYFV